MGVMPMVPAVVSSPAAPLGYVAKAATTGVLPPFDEFLTATGEIRPAWTATCGYLERLGVEEIRRRWNRARKILRDNGVAYNVRTRGGETRAWELNPVPFCLDAGEWEPLCAALRQRARLLDAILADCYGPRKLIDSGRLPAALVFGNRQYLRPCHGVEPVKGPRLVQYAVDIARSPNGKWWVVSDRTQAPSGVGYAVENRAVMARVFPEFFREQPLARIGGFLEQFAESLAALSPRPSGDPTVVLLTPGPLTETYFEHAYLARHLGCLLVQGQDLTVRDDLVYIKTLDGLRQVDVILRRVDEDYCDPLELRDESLLGVPGLVAALRAGNVSMANALGTGLVEAPALSAFLPVLCRHLLGEELRIPSVATWWCGAEPALAYVSKNWPALVLRNAFLYEGDPVPQGFEPADAASRIRDRGPFLAAQEAVRLSQCPDFNGKGLEPRSTVLRLFLIWDGEDYRVMPGGLARVAEEESSDSALLQQTGGSKDVWLPAVTETGPVRDRPVIPVEVRRPAPGLTSRLADNLFWIGRYAQRAESTCRIARCIIQNLSEEPGWVEQAETTPFLTTLERFWQWKGDESQPTESLLAVQLADPENPGSLPAILKRLHALAATVREQVSSDTWRVLNWLGELAEAAVRADDLPLDETILALSALNGLMSEAMPQGYGWRFLDLGRRLEAGFYLSRLGAETLRISLDQKLGHYELLLEALDSRVTYRQRNAVLRIPPVLGLLFCDESNPRSLASLLAGALEHVRQLPGESEPGLMPPDERRLLAALSDVRLLNPHDAAIGEGALRLVEVLERVSTILSETAEAIGLRYFTHLRTANVGLESAEPNLPEI